MSIMTNENLSIAEDKQIGKTARIIAGTICESKSLPFYLVSFKPRGSSWSRNGRLSVRVFATIKNAFGGEVPTQALRALEQDCENNLTGKGSQKVLASLKIEDFVEQYGTKVSKKPSVKAKAKTSTKSKPTAKVTPKEDSMDSAINDFADALEAKWTERLSKINSKVTPKESAKPATNAFAKSLEINMKAMDQEDEQSDLINAMLELAKS